MMLSTLIMNLQLGTPSKGPLYCYVPCPFEKSDLQVSQIQQHVI